MNSTKYILNLSLIVLVLIILVSPLLYWYSIDAKWETFSNIEERYLAVFPDALFRNQRTAVKRVFQGMFSEAIDLFFNDDAFNKDRSFQNQVESAIADQFPERIRMTEFSRTLERALISTSYALLPDPAFPTSLDTSSFITKERTRLFEPPIIYNASIKREINRRIENYSELINGNPNINFYALNIETIEYSKFNPLAKFYGNSDSGQSVNYFMENKPKNLQFRNFGISSYQDYDANFFRTDHHWNIRGALKAYKLIYEMLSKNYEEINPILDVSKIRLIDDLDFLGTYARRSLFPIKPEAFEYVEVKLPEYKTYVNGELRTYGGRERYLSGDFLRDNVYNHYQGFYGTFKKLIEYDFQNSSNRNLLIIGSSHARMIQLLIASHYHKTYVIDLRVGEVKAISLKLMISEYQIDDVLVLGQPEVTYLSNDYAITP